MPSIETAELEVHYVDSGEHDGWSVVLLHGFPYDVHAYDEVAPILVKAGARVIVSYLRGHGPIRFLSDQTIRSGQQAALASDLIALLDALSIDQVILAGFDWGGLTACTATALFPERVTGLVSYAGYDIIDIEAQMEPCHPNLEKVMWYQHLFQTERGRACLKQHRRELCQALWSEWSPTWKFSDATFDATAVSFENSDFVDVVIHAYRFAFGLAAGDSKYEDLERRLMQKPKIVVPAITLDGMQDPLKPGGTKLHAEMFTARHQHRTFDCGHAFPHERPRDFVDAILTVKQ